MDLARAPRRAPLTARKKGSGYENGSFRKIQNHQYRKFNLKTFLCNLPFIFVSVDVIRTLIVNNISPKVYIKNDLNNKGCGLILFQQSWIGG
jgi:hypothetical protein